MTCKDLMTANPTCCTGNDRVSRAAEIMRDQDVGPVPVVADPAGNRLLGILTDRDIAVKVVAAGRSPESTLVSEVMSSSPVTCREDEDCHVALDHMARHQVRRIPVVRGDGSLAGIISQADVARKLSEKETGEVVEEISEPMGMGHGFSGSRAPSALLAGASCFTVGLAAMYLMDPSRGRARRALLQQKAERVYRESTHVAQKVGRDLQNRAQGVVASVQSSGEGATDDRTLEARVRSTLGRSASHPRAIRVVARDGWVTLEGSLLAGEHESVLSAVRAVRGVRELEDRLQTHADAAQIPDLQGGHERSGRSTWSPAARFLASAVGGGLVFFGMRARGPLAKATASVGAGLLARGIANREIRSLVHV